MTWPKGRRPSPALVIALIALFVALGGTGYAALKLPKNSVGTKQLKKNAVISSKVKNGSLTGADIKDGSLAGADLNVGTLGTVPSAINANHANSADNAGHAGTADSAGTAAVATSIGTVHYVKGNEVTAPANGTSVEAESERSTATCPDGTVAIGAATASGAEGVEVSQAEVLSTAPGAPPTEVRAYFDNFTNFEVTGNWAIAICVAASAVDNPAPLRPAKLGPSR